MLRLMLAEAEIRHARETGAVVVAEGMAPYGPNATPARRRWWDGWPRTAAAVAVAAVLAAGLGYAAMRPASPRADALIVQKRPVEPAGMSGTIVRLDSGDILMPGAERASSGFGDAGNAVRDARPLQFAMPVDLKTPSPTF